MKLKRTPLFFAAAALVSAGAWANDSAQSQTEQGQPQAQVSSGASQGAQSQNLDQDTVKQAQQKLSEQGYEAGPADGIMGPKTQAAVKKLQQDKSLQASGQLDDQTLAALGVSEQSSSTGSSSAPSDQPSGSASGSSSDQSSSEPSSGSSSAQPSSDQSTGTSGGDSAASPSTSGSSSDQPSGGASSSTGEQPSGSSK